MSAGSQPGVGPWAARVTVWVPPLCKPCPAPHESRAPYIWDSHNHPDSADDTLPSGAQSRTTNHLCTGLSRCLDGLEVAPVGFLLQDLADRLVDQCPSTHLVVARRAEIGPTASFRMVKSSKLSLFRLRPPTPHTPNIAHSHLMHVWE